MTRLLKVAALQAAFPGSRAQNIARVTDLCRQAAGQGAAVILPPELFEGPYFPQEQLEENFALARPADGHPTLAHFASLARELDAVIPVSFFESDGPRFFNSVAVIDADGAILGIYRKSHIPDGPGYQEKFYFRPGSTGFRRFDTRHGKLGVAICWDQWFPEVARAMALAGADVLLYPTAIGSEPHDPGLDTRDPWRRVMQGHAVANATPVVAANRTGREGDLSFYGSSFVANHRGDIVAELGEGEEGVAVATLDLDEVRQYRAGFGFFRDRRPELYAPLTATE